MKILSILLALAGLLIATAIVAWTGIGAVKQAVLTAGLGGFALFTLCQFMLFLILGTAWQVLTPEIRLQKLIYSRMVRDAASNCLPFSHLGGIALGVRTAILNGVPWARAAASSTADVTAEFFAQISFALMSLAWLLWRVPGSAIIRPVGLALVAAVPVIAAFFLVQRGAGSAFAFLGKQITGDWGEKADHGAGKIDAAFAEIYAAPRRLAWSAGLHVLGWWGAGVASFVAFRALGTHIGLLDAMAVEGLVDAAMIFAFIIPGQLGAQEAAWVAMGAAFGVAAPVCLAVSLMRRARDIGLGVPVLLAWQAVEGRRTLKK